MFKPSKNVTMCQCDRPQMFLVMVNYLYKCSSILAELEDRLTKFIENNVPFVWGPDHTKAFDTIKKEVTSSPILKYYDPSKLLIKQTDASLKGLAVVLLQEDHLIYFAIKILQPHQRAYVIVELTSLLLHGLWKNFTILFLPKDFSLKQTKNT